MFGELAEEGKGDADKLGVLEEVVEVVGEHFEDQALVVAVWVGGWVGG